MRRALSVSAIAAFVAALALSSVALGHAALVSSTPSDGATISAPIASVSVTFDEEIGSTSHLEVLDAGGAPLAAGSVSPTDARTMTAPFVARDGRYEIRWTAASADGDIARGVVRYSVALAPSAAPTTAPFEPAPSHAAESPRAQPAPQPTDASVILPIAIVLVVVVAGFLVTTRRGRGQ